MKRLLVSPVIAVLLAGLLVAGCGQAAPAPAPTKAPAAAGATTAPAASAPTAAPAASQSDWPKKGRSVMVVIPYAAGGATDVGTRMMLPYFEKEFGVPFEAANKTGAGSQIGLTEIANAKPDGYTIGCGNLPAAVTTYLDASRKASYNRASFEPIGLSNADPVSIAVKADSPYKTFKELIDAAKANPKKVRAGTTTLTGPSHMALLELQKMADIQFATVGFDGDAPAITALLGGHLDALFVYVGPANAQVKSGEVRLLAVADDKQNKYAPGVKTFAEEGYKISWATSRMLLAPAGVPKDIVNRLSTAMEKALQSEELINKFAQESLEVRYMNPTQLGAYWDDQEARVKPLMPMLVEPAKK